ncbi:MAG: YncE family protein [Polyangia bacterium]
MDDGVAGDPPDPADPADLGAGESPSCLGKPLPLQNPRSHTLGETFYLPQLVAGPGCPAEPTWEVLSAPAGSKNVVWNRGAAYPRFTPDVEGSYVLRLRGVAGTETSLQAVRRAPAERFRNHYLTPLYGMARVGDELWTANGQSYTVTRLRQDAQQKWQKRDEITVGSWPAAVAYHPGDAYAVVANRGSDTIGFIDRARGVQEDALWVGDEPTGLAMAPDGARLYVSLPTAGEIAVVDLKARSVVKRVPVGFDPRALALSADGSRLFVASYRSGNLQNGPGKMRDPSQDQDLWVVNTSTLAVEKTILTVAADLRALALAPDGTRLYVAATDGDTVSAQTDPMAKPFVHLVSAVDVDARSATYGQVTTTADLTRQPSAKDNPFVNPAGIAVGKDTVWVSAESSNQVVVLDRSTLAERARVPVGAGPRQIVVLDDAGTVAVHCFRSLQTVIIDATGKAVQTLGLADDPRPAAVALGEEVFSRPGAAYARNHACVSCHVETQNDGMVWNFGPRVYHNVRPLQLLDATTPIEWGAYVSNTANFGIQGPSSIVGRPPTQQEAEGLAAFLASLIGAPRANADTLPDGSYSDAALRGQKLFEQKLSCGGCHTPGLYTSRSLIATGKSGEPADVPSLLGVYRHGVYMVNGQARGLAQAVDVALAYTKSQVTAAERQDLIRFLGELTPKGAAPLSIWPDIDSNQAVGSDVQPWARFSEEIDDSQSGKSASQLAAEFVLLETTAGQRVAGSVTATLGQVQFAPAQPLTAGESYRFRVLPGLPFRRGGTLGYERSTTFTVAKPAAGKLAQSLVLTVHLPPMGPGPGTDLPFDAELLTPRDGSQALRLHLSMTQTQTLWLQISGDKFYLQGFALPLPMRGVADAGDASGTVTAAAGQITALSGTLRMGAPGIKIPGILFDIKPKP